MKSNDQIAPKQAEAKRDGVINPQNYNLINFKHGKVSISNGSKVIAKVKVDNRQTDKQTGQKQYALDHSNRGITIVNNPPYSDQGPTTIRGKKS